MNVKIFERFRAACDDFFGRKTEFFRNMKAQFNENADKFNAEQKKEINAAIGRYQAAALKAGLKEAAGAVEELVEGAKGFLEGLGGDKDE